MKKTWEEQLKEKLADIEHQRWGDWQEWCHKILRENCPSSELEKVLERWDRQIATNYKDLSEKEKDSDRDQVDRYFPLIEKQIAIAREKAFDDATRVWAGKNFKSGVAIAKERMQAKQEAYQEIAKELAMYKCGKHKRLMDKLKGE